MRKTVDSPEFCLIAFEASRLEIRLGSLLCLCDQSMIIGSDYHFDNAKSFLQFALTNCCCPSSYFALRVPKDDDDDDNETRHGTTWHIHIPHASCHMPPMPHTYANRTLVVPKKGSSKCLRVETDMGRIRRKNIAALLSWGMQWVDRFMGGIQEIVSWWIVPWKLCIPIEDQ